MRSLAGVCIAVSLVGLPCLAHAQSEPNPALASTAGAEEEPYGTVDIVGGGLAGTFLGLGIGHAVQGRYGERGWIFTVGELGSGAAYVAGAMSCADDGECNKGLLIGGVVGLLAFRTVELVDVWVTPISRNRTARRRRSVQVAPYAMPTGSRSGVAGLAISF